MEGVIFFIRLTLDLLRSKALGRSSANPMVNIMALLTVLMPGLKDAANSLVPFTFFP